MIHIAHIINPILAPVYSELNYTQNITFESMKVAKDRAKGVCTIDLLTAQFEEDHPVLPGGFTVTKDLERSVLDMGHFTHKKKFPLLCDLVKRLYDYSDAEYLIYTNTDIALQPHFYLKVIENIESGLDAFIINRRGIPDHYNSPDQLSLMYKEKGVSHPGFDCFVFHRSLYDSFDLGHVCVGIPFVGITFSQNLFCYSDNFQLFDTEHWTFHIGEEIFKKRDGEYFRYNKGEFWKTMKRIWKDLDSKKFPYGDRNMIFRMIRWGLHPSIPIRLALMLEPRRHLNQWS